MPARVTIDQRVASTSIIRFDVQQRAQHTLMFCSFAILAVTGLPLKYSGWASSEWWVGVWGGLENVRVAHRYAAWLMMAVCVYHLMYLVVKRPFPLGMLPKSKDIRDFVQDMKHTFHLSEEPPEFDRFSYRNKFAYWLVYVGAFVMVGSGLILMYPIGATEAFSSWMLPLSLVIHSDGAILAIGWMVIVHMYFAHFSRHTIPIDKSIFTGKVPAERYREEFPLEYQRIMAAAGFPVAAVKKKTPPAPEEPLAIEEPLEIEEPLPEE